MSSQSKLSPSNLAVGAAVSLFEVTTLGQPLEVLKTHMASHRSDNLRTAIRKTYAKGGWKSFYDGLIPWAWIESSTTGGILLFTSSFVEQSLLDNGIKPGAAGLMGGVAGGAAQAYLAMGVCTTMKTAEITRDKTFRPSTIPGAPSAPASAQVPSTWQLFANTYKKEGIRGMQMTNWGSRIGIARAAETSIRNWRELRPLEPLSAADKVLASAIGGALSCFNQPFEVIRVEMQSLAKKSPSSAAALAASAVVEGEGTGKPARPTMASTAKYIYAESGMKGFFRGVTPRVGLSTWRTICLVSLGDHVKGMVAKLDKASGPASVA
ncbi:hypothetical protein JCM8097_006523 [Rhodosporidiobolus ruineniae]